MISSVRSSILLAAGTLAYFAAPLGVDTALAGRRCRPVCVERTDYEPCEHRAAYVRRVVERRTVYVEEPAAIVAAPVIATPVVAVAYPAYVYPYAYGSPYGYAYGGPGIVDAGFGGGIIGVGFAGWGSGWGW